MLLSSRETPGREMEASSMSWVNPWVSSRMGLPAAPPQAGDAQERPRH